jgi:hypothetical protein
MRLRRPNLNTLKQRLNKHAAHHNVYSKAVYPYLTRKTGANNPSMKKKRRKASDLLDEFDLKMIMEALKLDKKRRVDYVV